MTARPGTYDHRSLQKVLWQDTTLGAALIELYHMFRAADDQRLNAIARIIVPREAVDESTGDEIPLSRPPKA